MSGAAPSTSIAARDIDAYLARIDYRGPLHADFATLDALHLAHATHIPFENLDVLLGRPPRLDLPSLVAKLVAAARGGYCFEHNVLFAAVLKAIGFDVRRLAARVRWQTTRVLPRTHTLLRVVIDGADWLADVGFGAEGLLQPVAFAQAQGVRHGAWSYRVVEHGDVLVLQSLHGERWEDLYAFTLEPQELVDLELANHYTATHPDSRFVHTLTVQLPGLESRRTLRDRELIVETATGTTVSAIAGDDALLEALASHFGIRLPAGTRFPMIATAR